jgi:hypothetical protein
MLMQQRLQQHNKMPPCFLRVSALCGELAARCCAIVSLLRNAAAARPQLVWDFAARHTSR